MTTLQLAHLNEGLVFHQACAYEAIKGLFPFCETPTDSDERTWLSIQLSVCEFEAAYVVYPKSCLHKDSLQACTAELMSHAPWWTTFSGSYNHISTLCAEYQSTHEAEIAAKLYRNLSYLTVELRDDLQDLFESLHGMKKEAQGQKALMTELHNSLNAVRELTQEFSKISNHQREVDELIHEAWNQEMGLALQRKNTHQAEMESIVALSDEAARAMVYLSEQQKITRNLALQHQFVLDLLRESKDEVANLVSEVDQGLAKIMKGPVENIARAMQDATQNIEELNNEVAAKISQHENTMSEGYQKLMETTDQLVSHAVSMQSVWSALWVILKLCVKFKPLMLLLVILSLLKLRMRVPNFYWSSNLDKIPSISGSRDYALDSQPSSWSFGLSRYDTTECSVLW